MASQVAGVRSLSVSCHEGFPTAAKTLAADFSQSERVRQQAREKPQSFRNLISEMTSHYFQYVLFIRSEGLDSAHTQEERNTQGNDYHTCLGGGD